LNADGWVKPACRVASPNFDERPETNVSLIVIHNISLPPRRFGGRSVLRLFTNTLDTSAHRAFASLVGLRVSAHFLIRRRGDLIQLVSCSKRAWHAGVSVWQGREQCNDFSIGIELEGSDDIPYTRSQYRCLYALLTLLVRRYPITDIVGHSGIAPNRKTDPGAAFEWRKIEHIGLSPRVTVHRSARF
jgi:AmpD protein